MTHAYMYQERRVKRQRQREREKHILKRKVSIVRRVETTSQKVLKAYMILHCHSKSTFSTQLTFLSGSLI
jgi:hypothetical protein